MFRNRQEGRKAYCATCPGLAEKCCGGVVFATMTGNLPCDKYTTLAYGHLPKEFYLKFCKNNRFTYRLEKGEGSRTIEYSPQELG